MQKTACNTPKTKENMKIDSYDPFKYTVFHKLFSNFLLQGPSLRFIAQVFYSPGAVGVKDQIFIKARAGVKACTLWNFVYRYRWAQ